MKHILILIMTIVVCISCSTSPMPQPEGNPQIAPPFIEITPEMENLLKEADEDPVGQEYDKIIHMCTGMFEYYGTAVKTYCILRNFYAMNNVDRLYIEDMVTDDEFRDCHAEEFYFPEYKTFWYSDVWDCLKEGDTNDD